MIIRPIRPAGLVVAMVLLAAGCAGPQPLREAFRADSQLPAAVELQDTPYYPQEDYQCGPAALATVLGAAGIEVTPASLAGKVFLPERQGSLQLELVAAARRYQRLPYTLEPGVDTLLPELAAGRPVLVLQNLGLRSLPVWHYAVVIGFDTQRNEIILRSGRTARHVMRAEKFMRTWERADFWAMVILRPGEFPQRPDATRYVHAIAALESAGQLETAAVYYRAALVRWPDNTLAMFGLGNARYAQGELTAAAALYRRLLDIQPGHVAARNNLAQLLADRGSYAAALLEIEAGLANSGESHPLRRQLLETRDSIRAAAGAGTQID